MSIITVRWKKSNFFYPFTEAIFLSFLKELFQRHLFVLHIGVIVPPNHTYNSIFPSAILESSRAIELQGMK